MLAHVRVGFVAALVTLVSIFASIAIGSIPASAAGKAFQRGDLDEAAIKLEAEVKTDAGSGSKPSGARAQCERKRMRMADDNDGAADIRTSPAGLVE